MERIAIDMDGVLADVVEQFFLYDEKDFGKRKTIEEIIGRPESISFPKCREYVYTKGFFRYAPVMKESREILSELNKRYEIFIVSAAMEFPQSLSEKHEWLNEHFPFITWQQIVFCGSKTIVEADMMIDDHFKNLDHFKGATFLFSQPHNLLQNAGRHKRVHSWNEIADLLL
ncbi:MAG TPA: 5'(3')-deoxyribonucleotidase [Chitinophagaceae bacterium]|jgi:5'(3')-deoxyribonucleotidase|nr:5'(3')-deoxyribonucleotidase [Chitinophagaceae bacterium]